MIKIGDFNFSKPPEIFRVHHGQRSTRFFLAGSVPDQDEFGRLQETLHGSGILDLTHELGQTRVIVADKNFLHDAIWGQRYELVLLEYKPVELTRHNIATAEVENIGDKLSSPRFRIVAEYEGGHQQLPRGDILDYEARIQIALTENDDEFKLKFKDKYPIVHSRADFNKWTIGRELTVEVLLGYLEQGDLLSVVRGAVHEISHGIDADGNWVYLHGKSKPQERAQEFDYLITDKNIFRGKVVRTEQGEFLVSLEIPLLPDLKPKDIVDVYWSGQGIHDMQMAKVDSVMHLLSTSRVPVTRFRFAMKI